MLAVLAVGGLRTASLLCACALLAAGVAASAWQLRWMRRAQAAARRQATEQEALTRIAALCSTSAPVWARQLETARRTADGEVAELSRVFGGLARKLEHALGGEAGKRPAQDRAVGVLESNGAELGNLVAALQSLQDSKHHIVDEIGRAAAQLKESAAEVREVALLTRMVSLNATIEAARAGEAGRAFGVVVADMRQLVARTAAASEQFSRHADALHGLVTGAFDAQGEGDGSIAWAQELVRQVITSMEAVVLELSTSVSTLSQERQDVRADISRVLVALQFQDRVSQILAHVGDNLGELLAEAAPEGTPREPAGTGEWLQRIASNYSTPEEFDNLDALPPPAAARGGGSEITYF
jgi:methyl-accepting chemotaxis protein